MKYEADIIKEIVDSRGHTKTSIHYQSECVEEWVKEVEGAYPKLCDYQPEWLNYSNENKIGVFPYVALTDVTNATVENVVPYAYKRAILSGQTLVNLLTQNSSSTMYATRTQIDRGYRYTQQYSANMSATRFQWDTTNSGHNRLKPNTKYYVQFTVKVNKSRGVRVSFEGGSEYASTLAENSTTTIKCTVRCGESLKRFFVYVYPPTDESYTGDTFDILDFMTIEYQDGMENWDIPYFEGMQSVQMPVLTTIGKNFVRASEDLFVYRSGFTKPSVVFENGGFSFASTFNGSICGFRLPIKLLKDKTYYVKCDYENMLTIRIYGNDVLNNEIDTNWETIVIAQNGGSFTFDKQFKYYYVCFYPNADSQMKIKNLQIEEGSIATPYEPYKPNILTVNEPVELRGIGDVKDTLDCLTGEVTQRIGEYIIDGNENWAIYELYTFEGYKSFITTITGLDNLYTGANTFISGDFKMESWNGYRNGAEGEFVWNHDPNRIGIKVKNETVSNVEELKTFLASNPIRFKYELATESFKTVDLSVVDQDGKEREQIKPIEGTMHLNTSGETINPLFSGEVPVEAITQNLASFIEE